MSADARTLLEEVTAFWAPQADKPDETPESVTRALWLAAAGRPVSATRALELDLPDLAPEQAARLRQLVAGRRAGVPLAYLTGRQSFMGLELLAAPEALIPRKETEILGRAVLDRLRALADVRGTVLVLDVCTGGGNLALAFARHEPRARVFASDLSAGAIGVARRNQALLGLAGRIEFRVGDLFAPFESGGFDGACDLVSCNPPYISTARVAEMPGEIAAFEPALAFDGGAYGVSILMRLVRQAPRFLKPGSWLCVEVGAGQGPVLAQQIRRIPAYAGIDMARDAAGEIRALLARTAV